MDIWNEQHTRILKDNEIDSTTGIILYDGVEDYYYFHLFSQEDLRTFEEQRINAEIANRQVELQATDYIVIKIYEAVIDNDQNLANELKQEYATQLARRKVLRQEINQLQSQLD